MFAKSWEYPSTNLLPGKPYKFPNFLFGLAELDLSFMHVR